MFKFSKLLVFFFCGIYFAQAQNLSEIRFNQKQTHFFYVKDDDSLFVKPIDVEKPPKLITDGLKNNSFSIYRKWVQEDTKILFEKGNALYTYDVRTEQTTEVLPQGKLRLFMFYQINQIGSSKYHIYFAAGEENGETFHLYQLNLQNHSLQRIAEEADSINIANVAVHEESNLLAYSFYKSDEDKVQSGIRVIDLQTNKIVFHQPLHGQCFYANLSFVSDEQLLARNRYGENHLFSFGRKYPQPSVEKLPINEVGYALKSLSSEEILTLSFSGQKRLYHSYNVKTKEKQVLLSRVNRFIGGIRKTDNSYSIYFTEENGKTPKQILTTVVDPTKKESSSELVFKLNQKNPFESTHYNIIEYKNGDQKTSRAYFYSPENMDTSQEKLPVIIMAYGGYGDYYPDLSYFMNATFFEYLKKGFGIILLNTRGVANERRKDEYGKVQLADTERFISKLKTKYPVDEKQIFVAGHSHGATMVLYYLTHSDVFAGGIAVNGAADWIAQAKLKSMTGLPWEMGGEPDELPEKYKAYSPIENLTKHIKPLLIVAGAEDTQIHANINAGSFYEKAKKLEANVQYLKFEDEGHLIQKKENLTHFKNTVERFIRKVVQ